LHSTPSLTHAHSLSVIVRFPESRPSVVFLSDIYHPLVDPMTRQLDLTLRFPTWTPSKDFLFHLLIFLKSIFLKVPREDYTFREAHHLLLSNPTQFEERAQESAQLSIAKVDNAQEGSSITFSELSHADLDKYTQLILTFDQTRVETEEGREEYMEELLAQFPNVLLDGGSEADRDLDDEAREKEGGKTAGGAESSQPRPGKRVTFAPTNGTREHHEHSPSKPHNGGTRTSGKEGGFS